MYSRYLRSLLCLVATFSCGGAAADDDHTAAAMAVYGKQAAEIRDTTQENVEKYKSEHLEQLSAILSGAKSAVQDAMQKAAAGMPQHGKEIEGVHFVLFVSGAMPAGEMRSAMELSSTDPRVRLVFRGLLADHSIVTFSQWIKTGAHDLDPLPVVAIDPPLYAKLQIVATPTLVALDGEKETGRVEGLMNPGWLADQVAAKGTHDFGAQGPTFVPTEPDLMELIKAQFASLDANQLAKPAMDHFWSHQAMTAVSRAVVSKDHLVDPTIRVTQDIVGPDGKAIAHAGDTVNPLLKMNFSQKLIVIDARLPGDRAFAKKQISEAQGRRVVVMTVGTPEDAASDHVWDRWHAWESDIGAPLYLLSNLLRDRFQVDAVPSVIEANAGKFLVSEVALAKE